VERDGEEGRIGRAHAKVVHVVALDLLVHEVNVVRAWRRRRGHRGLEGEIIAGGACVGNALDGVVGTAGIAPHRPPIRRVHILAREQRRVGRPRQTLIDAHVAIDDPIPELDGAGRDGPCGGIDVDGRVGGGGHVGYD